MTALCIQWNDAWESVPLEFSDEIAAYFTQRLQPTHPLRAYKLFPVAKCWRRNRFLVEEEVPSENLWVLDFEKRKRVRGKSYVWYVQLTTQQQLDDLLQADYEEWVQYMKDAGAWNE